MTCTWRATRYSQHITCWGSLKDVHGWVSTFHCFCSYCYWSWRRKTPNNGYSLPKDSSCLLNISITCVHGYAYMHYCAYHICIIMTPMHSVMATVCIENMWYLHSKDYGKLNNKQHIWHLWAPSWLYWGFFALAQCFSYQTSIQPLQIIDVDHTNQPYRLPYKQDPETVQ